MCHYCFDVLVNELASSSSKGGWRMGNSTTTSGNNSEHPRFAATIPDSAEAPLFITWDKRRSTSDESFDLRGCIGTLSPRPLLTAVGEYALTSAFRDRRFDPIKTHEVPHLRVAVSLLVNYEECSHCHDWVVGVHGIIIKFTERGVDYSATYLPEVANEQGWALNMYSPRLKMHPPSVLLTLIAMLVIKMDSTGGCFFLGAKVRFSWSCQGRYNKKSHLYKISELQEAFNVPGVCWHDGEGSAQAREETTPIPIFLILEPESTAERVWICVGSVGTLPKDCAGWPEYRGWPAGDIMKALKSVSVENKTVAVCCFCCFCSACGKSYLAEYKCFGERPT